MFRGGWSTTFTSRLCGIASRTAGRNRFNGLRSFSQDTTASLSRRPLGGRILRVGLGSVMVGGTLGGTAYMYGQHSIHADHDEEAYRSPDLSQTPLSTLLRSYIVYSLCSMPTLVDWSPSILSTLFSVPGVRSVTEAIIRATFFAQFVGADTAVEALPLLERLRNENKGVLFAYSVEVDENEAAGKTGSTSSVSEPINELPLHKRIVEEMIHSINVAADFEDQQQHGTSRNKSVGRRTWVALKLSAMVPNAQALINLSRHLATTRPDSVDVPFPGCPHKSDLDILDFKDGGALVPSNTYLSVKDIQELRELKEDLSRICQCAQERGVKLIIDAEHSWYQPAIDAYTLHLMRTYNAHSAEQPHNPSIRSLIKRNGATSTSDAPSISRSGLNVQPLIYATFQAYLRRTPEYIRQSLKDAEEGNYVLGVKLVRGAYHPHETMAHHSAKVKRLSLTSHELVETGTLVDKSSKAKSGHGDSPSISPDELPPVWALKSETDACYNKSVQTLIEHVHKDFSNSSTPFHLGILFGTHNPTSCGVILDSLVDCGLASKEFVKGRGDEEPRDVLRIPEEVAERVTVAQLYGMRDFLTNSLVERTRCTVPFVIKYVPYGALTEVMPYLSRRAIENKSVLGEGGAAEERRRTGQAIYRKIFG